MTTQITDAVLSDTPPAQGRMRHQLPRFAVVGVLSGVVYAALYVAFRAFVSAYLANTLALGLSAVFNTEMNRHFTFGIRQAEPSTRMKHQVKGFVMFLVGLVVTEAALLLLHTLSSEPARWVEITVLTLANLVATVTRFVAMRIWIFRH